MKRPKALRTGMLGMRSSHRQNRGIVHTGINANDMPGQWNGTKESHAN
jgi:hypothetical protein